MQLLHYNHVAEQRKLRINLKLVDSLLQMVLFVLIRFLVPQPNFRDRIVT